MKKVTLSVIGLGKLGLPFVACWVKKGFPVIGVDVNEQSVQALVDAKPLSYEPQVQELLEEGGDLITATTDIVRAVEDSDVTFIFVGTPGDATGKFTTEYVNSACEKIGGAIKEKDTKQMIVLVSSVTAGSIEEDIIPTLEQYSGKKVNEGFDFCYSPVIIALGSMVRDYFNPDLALIGGSSSEAGDRLQELLFNLYDHADVPVVRTNFVNAELIKLTLSTFVTTKITYANLLAQLCANIPGADVDVVTDAMGLDSRIGPKAMRGGMPYGGPCFPRDNRALLYLLDKYKIDRSLVASTDSFNKNVIAWLSELTERHVGVRRAVAVLGLTFKPDTDVVDESAAMDMTVALFERGLNVVAFDPQGNANARHVLQGKVSIVDSAKSAIEGAEVVVIATAWTEFKNQLPVLLSHSSCLKAVLDPWRVLDASTLSSSVRYIPIGKQAVESLFVTVS